MSTPVISSRPQQVYLNKNSLTANLGESKVETQRVARHEDGNSECVTKVDQILNDLERTKLVMHKLELPAIPSAEINRLINLEVRTLPDIESVSPEQQDQFHPSNPGPRQLSATLENSIFTVQQDKSLSSIFASEFSKFRALGPSLESDRGNSA